MLREPCSGCGHEKERAFEIGSGAVSKTVTGRAFEHTNGTDSTTEASRFETPSVAWCSEGIGGLLARRVLLDFLYGLVVVPVDDSDVGDSVEVADVCGEDR